MLSRINTHIHTDIFLSKTVFSVFCSRFFFKVFFTFSAPCFSSSAMQGCTLSASPPWLALHLRRRQTVKKESDDDKERTTLSASPPSLSVVPSWQVRKLVGRLLVCWCWHDAKAVIRSQSCYHKACYFHGYCHYRGSRHRACLV